MWYAANSRFANRRQESRPPRGRIRQGEMKDENQVPGRGVDSVAHDGGSHGCLRARSDAGGEGQGAPVSGDDQEGCSGGYKGAGGSAVELQASAGPLVRGTGDGAYRGGGGPYPRKAGGKGHDGASWDAGRDVKKTDEAVLAMVPDRTHKAQAPEPLIPTNRFGSPEASIKHFVETRAATEDFLKTTTGLRDHVMDSPLGKLDGYEFVLFIAGHSERHTKQINEVKADPNFPKK